MRQRGQSTAIQLAKLAGFLDDAETDVLAYMTFPLANRAKLHSTNPLERLFPTAIVRLVGAILPEQSDEWAAQ